MQIYVQIMLHFYSDLRHLRRQNFASSIFYRIFATGISRCQASSNHHNQLADNPISQTSLYHGEMAERSIAAVLKTVDLRGSGGSNPSLSAKQTTSGRRKLAFGFPRSFVFARAFLAKDQGWTQSILLSLRYFLFPFPSFTPTSEPPGEAQHHPFS